MNEKKNKQKMNLLLSNNENDLHVTGIIRFYDFHSITLRRVFHKASDDFENSICI